MKGNTLVSWLLAAILAGSVILAATTAATSAAEEPQTVAPAVIPALTNWEGEPGSYSISRRSRILYDGQALRADARTLAEDLQVRLGRRVPTVPRIENPRTGDIVLDLDRGADYAKEAYEIETGDVARITARTDTGVFTGTRTLLQLLVSGDPVPAGSAVDEPAFADRGIEICPCALKISLPRIERLIKEMAYLKLNYLLLPLKVKSTTHPETNQWTYYTKDEARRIAAWGEKYHINVIPEINAPGHMEPFLYDRKDLQLVDADGHPSIGRIDITKPEAFDFYTDLIDEYAEIFDGPDWHLGADEYMLSSSYANYPQIGNYAKDQFGADAAPEDAFIDFINRVDDYVQERHGQQLRVWNDGLPRANIIDSESGPHPRLNRDITIEHWVPGHVTPQEFLDNGYTLTNAASSLYDDRGGRVSGHALCPTANGLDACMPTLWDDGWTPSLFEDGQSVAADERVSGAHLSLWQSVPTADTENAMERALFMPLRVIAERTWGSDPTDRSGARDADSYAAFVDRAHQLGHAPGWNNVQRRPVSSGTYTLRLRANDDHEGYLAEDQPDRGSPVGLGGDATQWQVEQTDDDYYRMISPRTGFCVSMPEASVTELLEKQPGVGAAATMEPCRSNRNTQKWQIGRSDPEGDYTLTNAIHQMPATVDDNGSIVQRPADHAAAAAWQITNVAEATLEVATTAELLEPGQPNEVTVALTNPGDRAMTDARTALNVPLGWQVSPATRPMPDVSPDGTSAVTFAVTPPQDAPTDVGHTLSASTSYANEGQTFTVHAAAWLHTDPISCAAADPAPGPDDEFEGNALDGCRWTDVKDPDLSGLEVANGSLAIRTQPGDLVNQTGTSITNLLLQPAGAGDMTAELKTDANVQERYQQAGLMIHSDDDNYVEMAVVADNSPGEKRRLYASLVSEQDGEFRKGGVVNVFDLPADVDHWFLRLNRQGNTYGAAYSTDGKTWTAMPGSVTNTKITDARVGLFAAGPGQQNSTAVSFDYFHLDHE